MSKLDEYNEKRDFDSTPEPKGKEAKSKGGLTYCIQRHEARRNHYDLRLEWNGALLSWAVPKGPSFNPSDKRLAVRVEDHPLDYRHFEGTIPKGEYGGGTVMLWDEGTWEPSSNVDNGLEEGSLKFVLKGKRLKGKWALVKLKSNDDGENWLLIKDKDEYSLDHDRIAEFDTSIKSGKTMDEIAYEGESAKKNPFSVVSAQKAKLAESVPQGEEWVYEIKYDGYRIFAFIENGKVRLATRNNLDYTDKFPTVAKTLKEKFPDRALILDGEMVVADSEGRTEFQALQNYIREKGNKNLVYTVFDLVALDGKDIRGENLSERKSRLQELLKGMPNNVCYSEHITGNGKQYYEAACRAGLEGIVAKRLDSVYTGERSPSWLKIKCGKRQEFVVGGFTRTEKKTEGLSALLLGYHENGSLVYAGRAGTGFDRKEMTELAKLLEPLLIDNPPFASGKVKSSYNEKVFYVKPELVAEIQFSEWTSERILRQPSYKGLRKDKDPSEVVMEKTEKAESKEIKHKEKPKKPAAEKAGTNKAGELTVLGIKISNPGKVVYENPLITKGDVVRYYEKIAEKMLPYLKNRILSTVRCPKGVGEDCFFKKHPKNALQGVVAVNIPVSDGEEEYFYIDQAKGLVHEAQNGTLEFHFWGSKVDTLEKPDLMVFDLDPDEKINLERVKEGVLDLKSILDELSLKSFLKTSGGKGYHIVVPFLPAPSWEAFSSFAKNIASVMEKKWPDKYTSNMRKAERNGKIFIDWVRNGRGATSVAPYSLRAKEGAKVSMPISYDELSEIAPKDIGIKEAADRMKSDPWKDFFKVKQELI